MHGHMNGWRPGWIDGQTMGLLVDRWMDRDVLGMGLSQAACFMPTLIVLGGLSDNYILKVDQEGPT